MQHHTHVLRILALLELVSQPKHSSAMLLKLASLWWCLLRRCSFIQVATDGQTCGINDKPIKKTTYYNVTLRHVRVAIVAVGRAISVTHSKCVCSIGARKVGGGGGVAGVFPSPKRN